MLDPVAFSFQGIWGTLCDTTMPDEHLENFWVASAANMLRLKSLDHTRRTYKNDDTISNLRSASSHRIQFTTNLRETFSRVKGVSDCFKPQGYVTERIGQFAAIGALGRLPATFYWSTIVAAHGYRPECSTLCRQIIEQIAWALRIESIDDESYWSIQPQSCVGSTKTYFPRAAKIYGLLSEAAHIHPTETRKYFEVIGSVSKITYSREVLPGYAAVLAELADMYSCACEIVLNGLGLPASNIEIDRDQLRLKDTREVRKWADEVILWALEIDRDETIRFFPDSDH